MSLRALTLLLLVLTAASAAAEEPVSIAVMEFTSKGGVTQDQMDALSDMLSNQIRSMGNYKVIGKSDIRSMLTMEEQRQRLSTCTDQSCLAEIGGALGARWVVVGNVSLFGKTYLLNLKLIDVTGASVASGVSRSIEGGEDKLLAELPSAAKEMFDAVAGQLAPAEESKTPKKPEVVEKKEVTEKKEEPTKPVKTGWFTAPADRAGKWRIWGSGELILYLSGDVSGENGGYLDLLENSKVGGRPRIGVGYQVLDWLAVVGEIGGYFTKAEYSVDGGGTEWHDCTYGALEFSAGIRLSVPMAFWLEPVASVTLGYSWMMGSTDASVSGQGLLVDVGLGIDVWMTSNWLVMARLNVPMRFYQELFHDDVNKESTAKIFALSGLLGIGWQF